MAQATAPDRLRAARGIRCDMDDRDMDDNDNRLFAVFAGFAWTPKPAFQLAVRTAIYAVGN
jgi:hypothetical protein